MEGTSGEIQSKVIKTDKPPGVKRAVLSGISRRDFLKSLGILFAHSALAGSPAGTLAELAGTDEVKVSPEKEASPFQPALVVDVPPFVDELKELREKGHVDERTQPLDLDAFLKKHIGTSFEQIIADYGSEAKRDFPGEANNLSLGKTLLKHGREREAVVLNLAF